MNKAMRKHTYIYIFLFLTFTLAENFNSTTSPAEENSYCPFGVCKGKDPNDLFDSIQDAELRLSFSNYDVSDVTGKLSDNWLFLTPIIADDKHNDEVAIFGAQFSAKTGVCISHLTMVLSDGMYPWIIKNSKEVLINETGYQPENVLINHFKGYQSFKWDKENLGNLKGVDSIVLNFAKEPLYMDQMVVNILIWYDNHSECKIYEPRILSQL